MPSARKLNVVNGCGVLGASVCTVIMLLPVMIGTAGASAAAACSMPGMCPTATGNPILDSFIPFMSNNWIAQPLLIVSLGLILFGMRSLGFLPLAMSAIGGGLLYVGMFTFDMAILMTLIGAFFIGVGYGTAYIPLWVESREVEKDVDAAS